MQRLEPREDIGFAPIGLDEPYRIVVGNNPVNWIDPWGLFPQVDPNKPFDRFNPNNLKNNKAAIDAFKKTLEKVKLVNKATKWIEKKGLAAGVSKIAGLPTLFGILLHPDLVNVNEDEMLRDYYRNLANSRCPK